MEVSSGFVWADVDAAGQGTGLSATVAGDVIASSVLTINIREAVTRVEDSSSTWDAGGDPQIAAYVRSASGNIDNVSGVVVSPTDGSAFWISGYNYSLSAWETVKDNSGTTWIAGGGGSLDASVIALNVFSGSVETSTTVLDASVDALNVFSGSVETSTTVLDASVDALNVFSGSVEASTTVLDASVDALNVFSGSVETSTTSIDGRITVLDASVDALNVFSGSVETSTTVLDASVDALNVFSGSVETSTTVLDASVDALNVFSGSVEASTTVLDASVDALNVFSGSVEASTTVLDASVDALNVFSGSVETSTTVLDASVDALNVFSGSVETSTTVLDASVDALNVFSGSVETSTTVLDASVDALNVFSGSVEASTAGIRDSSGTAWLTGATPTLSNDLDANAKNIRGVNSISLGPTAGSYDISGTGSVVIKSSTGDITLSSNRHTIVSATQDTRLVCGATNNIQYGPVAGALSSLIDNMSNLASVSGTGGGAGSFEGSATASAIYVGYPNSTSAVAVSGLGAGDGAVAVVGNNYILSIDAGTERVKWVSPPLITGAGDLQLIHANIGSEAATFSLGAATMLIRDIKVGNSLSAGPSCDAIFDRNVTASSCTILSSLSGSPKCDVVFSNNVSIENTTSSPPSNPIALILKTIDSSPTSPTNIGEVIFAGNNSTPANKVYNKLRGVADDVTAGTEDGSIELRHLTAGSEVVSLTANGTGVTVEESLTVSTCPVPAPVCYAQMDGDGTAAVSETKFGAGVTPTTVQDSTGHITWDNTNKEFDISVAGTYHVTATLVLNVATTTLTTIRVKNGATAKNTYVDHGTHSAEDPEEVTIQAAFTCAASDSITVTFQDDVDTNINLMAGSSVTVRRLF